MDAIEKLIQKLDEVWPGELGDDIDVCEIVKDLKVLKTITPLLAGIQAQKGTTPDQKTVYLIQVMQAIQVDERSYEAIKEYILDQSGYERSEAEVVNTENK